MAKMGRPPKRPEDRAVKVSVALRHGDVEVLQQLALERFVVATGKAGAVEAHRMIFEKGERPSVSSAIRYLIDVERDRRARKALAAWKRANPKKSPPSAEELLKGDFVFGKR